MRKIFIGSSTEALGKAKGVRCVLSAIEGTKGVLFNEFFEPGTLTFEALEEMLQECDGAVFIATPDDKAMIRGRETLVPRANVLLEFGLVAGRFGRHNVAVCRYGGAGLPSDLKGLTVIEMDGAELDTSDHKVILTDRAEPVISPQSDGKNGAEVGLERPGPHARRRLRMWVRRLTSTTEGIARTDLVHGYAGRWDFKVQLVKWMDFPIEYPSYAQINGVFDLFIPASGHAGKGQVRGRVLFKLYGQDPAEATAFQGELRSAHEITNLTCQEDGGMEFASEAFITQKISAIGARPPDLLDIDPLPGPWTAQWSLLPSSEPRTLVGLFRIEGSGGSQGVVKATKSDSLQ